jgi:hypothetical protein
MMTDVQVESTKTKKQKRARKQPNQAEQADWNKLVAQGKKLVAALHSKERELGKLADGVETKYGKESLARFAEELEVKVATLNRCRSAYRAFKGTDSGSGASFAVLKALQAHPDRAEIIKDNPKLTKRQATAIMRTWRQVQEQDQAQEQEQDEWLERLRNLDPQLRWKVIEARHWLDAAKKHALETIKYGHPAEQHLDSEVLRHAVDEPDKLVTTLRLGGQALNTLADEVECALTTPLALPPPMFDDNSTPDEGTSPDQTT